MRLLELSEKEKMKRKIITIILCFGLFFVLSSAEKSRLITNTCAGFISNSNHMYFVKDLNPKKFIELCVTKYNQNENLNFVVFRGDFPQNWVKKQDVAYLMHRINSKQKCCGYMNVFSSFVSSDNAEVGGFAILFMKSYIEKKQLNLGLNSNPKTSEKEVKYIMNWYKNNHR